MWFYIPDEWKECFYNEITQVGAKFMDGSEITKESIGTLMGIGKDKTVGYISNLVWYNTFFTDNAAVKVYYDKWGLPYYRFKRFSPPTLHSDYLRFKNPGVSWEMT